MRSRQDAAMISLRGRIVGAFVLISALVALGAAYCIGALMQADQTLDALIHAQVTQLQLASDLQVQVAGMAWPDVDSEGAGSASEQALEIARAEAAQKQFDGDLMLLDGLAEGQIADWVVQLTALSTQTKSARLQWLDNPSAAEAAQWTEAAAARRAQILDLIDALIRRCTSNLIQAEADARALLSAYQMKVLLLAGGVVLFGLAVALTCAVWLGRGLDRAVRAAEDLARGARLDLTGLSGGASGRLARALGRISEGRGEVVTLAEAIATGKSPMPTRRPGFHQKTPDAGAPAMTAGLARAIDEARGVHMTIGTAQTEARHVADLAEATVTAVDRLLTELGQIPLQKAETIARAQVRQAETCGTRIEAALTALQGFSLSEGALNNLLRAVDLLSGSAAFHDWCAARHGSGIPSDLLRLTQSGHSALSSLTEGVHQGRLACAAALQDLTALRPEMAELTAVLTTARTEADGQIAQTHHLAEDLWRQNLTGLKALTSLAVAEVRSADLVKAMHGLATETPEAMPATHERLLAPPADPVPHRLPGKATPFKSARAAAV